MESYIWDGPEDSDEEIEELLQYKNEYEDQLGIKYSKNGIIQFVENLVKQESKSNKADPKTARLWEEKLKTTNLTMSLKKGGSELSSDQPFLRSDVTFPSKYKVDKILTTVSQSIFMFYKTILFDFEYRFITILRNGT